MAKLTIEIDMDDPQETWDALYRRIEQFGEESSDQPDQPAKPAANQATYDLLLDPERAFGDVGDFFAVFGGRLTADTDARAGRCAASPLTAEGSCFQAARRACRSHCDRPLRALSAPGSWRRSNRAFGGFDRS